MSDSVDNGFVDRFTAFLKRKAELMDQASRAISDGQFDSIADDLTDHIADRTDVHGITVAVGKLVTFNNTLTFSGTDNEALTLTGSLTITADTTVSGGGTLALAGFTFTIPANGTAALASGGSANRVAYWSDTYTITSDADLTFDGTTLTLGGPFVLTGAGMTASVIAATSVSTSNNTLYNLSGTTTSNNTTQLSGLQVQQTFAPAGASLSAVFSLILIPTISSSTTPITGVNAVLTRVDTAASYTGVLTGVTLYGSQAPVFSGSSPTNLFGLRLPGITGGTNNYYILLGTNTPVAGSFAIYSASTNDSYLAGQLGLGNVTAPAALLHAQFTDNGTTNSPTVAIVDHTSSGTPSTNFGAAFDFRLKSSTTVGQDAARLTALWSTATHASRTSALLVSVVGNASALTEVARFTLDVPLILTQGTAGNEVFRLVTTATNDDPTERAFQNRQATTNNTATTIHTVAIPASTTLGIEVVVVSRRTGGSAGTAEDGAMYVRYATYKNVAGTATIIGAVSSPHTAEDQAGWDVTFNVSGANVQIQVTGATNNNVSWHTTLRTWAVSS